MLLNVACKIFAKSLQLKFQLVLMKVIDVDQMTFLLMTYILNILLAQEIID